jgi:acetyl-CoA acyltransferase
MKRAMTSRTVYVVDALRTPIGKWRGGLASVRADDLAAHVLSALVARHTSITEEIDQVIFGATNQAGEDNRNVARMAVLLANLPYTVPAVTVNRLCGSGLEAVNDAARLILAGEADVVVAGGVESMTRAPYTMAKPSEAFDRAAPTLYDTSLGWRFPNPKMAARFPLESMGETAENVATKYGISREDQDAFAAHSQEKAVAAWAAGAFEKELAPLTLPQKKGDPVVFARDESPREGVTAAALAKLPAVFRKGGSVTAGNSSPINDGAAAVLLASEEAVKKHGLTPLARWVGSQSAGVEPNWMGEGPIPATQKLLKRLDKRVEDLDLIELNEAFAAQSLACIRTLGLDPSRVNVRGGAIALGHPIGASGARIVGTLVHAMAQTGKKAGLASLCVGVGQGVSTYFEGA